jgi:hypothetical protein
MAAMRQWILQPAPAQAETAGRKYVSARHVENGRRFHQCGLGRNFSTPGSEEDAMVT